MNELGRIVNFEVNNLVDNYVRIIILLVLYNYKVRI